MTREAEKKIAQAKTWLVLHQPFYAFLLLGLEECWDDVPTMGASSRAIHYNRQWIEGLKVREIIGALVHEAMHLGFMHAHRRGERDPLLWNIACDLAVNNLIRYFLPKDVELPPDSLLAERFSDQSAEEIYTQLLARRKSLCPSCGQKHPTQDPGSPGDSKGQSPRPCPGGSWDCHQVWGEEKGREVQARSLVVKAAELAKMAGHLPSLWESIISEMVAPKVDWRERLRNFVVGSYPCDYRFVPPNRRKLWSGWYPSTTGEHLEGLFAIDTSGSMSDNELTLVWNELRGICESFESYRIHYVQCDAGIQSHVVLESGQTPPKRMVGRGGTSYQPVFELVTKLTDLSFVVYATDGYVGDNWPPPPRVPVLWLMTSDVQPPWGEYVHLGGYAPLRIP